MEGAIGPRIACLLQGLAADFPEAVEIDLGYIGLDLDHLAVDQTLEAENVPRAPGVFDGADAQAGGFEIGLAQKCPGDARTGREPRLECAADVVKDEFPLIFNWHK